MRPPSTSFRSRIWRQGYAHFDRRMPEERNRVVADHLSDLLLAPSVVAVGNLAAEGLGSRTALVGDVMVDALVATRAQLAAAPERCLPTILRKGPYLLATIHRAETTDDPDRLAATLRALAACPLPVMLLAHPRLADRARRLGCRSQPGLCRRSIRCHIRA